MYSLITLKICWKTNNILHNFDKFFVNLSLQRSHSVTIICMFSQQTVFENSWMRLFQTNMYLPINLCYHYLLLIIMVFIIGIVIILSILQLLLFLLGIYRGPWTQIKKKEIRYNTAVSIFGAQIVVSHFWNSKHCSQPSKQWKRHFILS